MSPTQPVPRKPNVLPGMVAALASDDRESWARGLARDLIDARKVIEELHQQLSDLRLVSATAVMLYSHYDDKGDTSPLHDDLQIAASAIDRMMRYTPEQSVDADRLYVEALAMLRDIDAFAASVGQGAT